MTGQADSAPLSTDDLAAFLVDNPEADAQEDQPTTGDEPSTELDNSAADPDADPEADPDPDADPDADPADPEADAGANDRQGLKFKVPVKGEDGADTTIEVDEKELIAGYQRHSDYTRKTMELGERERQAHDVVTQRLSEGLDHFVQQASKVKTAIVRLAGLKTDAEMAQLAAVDRDAYILEDARRKAVIAALEEIDSDVSAEVQQRQQHLAAQGQKELAAAWLKLGNAGINKDKLLGIFGDIGKAYGIEEERFKVVRDPRLVLIMRDALAYRQLQDKAKTLKGKVRQAPQLPAARQSTPKSEQVNKRLDKRFHSGKANTRDLASFLLNNKL